MQKEQIDGQMDGHRLIDEWMDRQLDGHRLIDR